MSGKESSSFPQTIGHSLGFLLRATEEWTRRLSSVASHTDHHITKESPSFPQFFLSLSAIFLFLSSDHCPLLSSPQLLVPPPFSVFSLSAVVNFSSFPSDFPSGGHPCVCASRSALSTGIDHQFLSLPLSLFPLAISGLPLRALHLHTDHRGSFASQIRDHACERGASLRVWEFFGPPIKRGWSVRRKW